MARDAWLPLRARPGPAGERAGRRGLCNRPDFRARCPPGLAAPGGTGDQSPVPRSDRFILSPLSCGGAGAVRPGPEEPGGWRRLRGLAPPSPQEIAARVTKRLSGLENSPGRLGCGTAQSPSRAPHPLPRVGSRLGEQAPDPTWLGVAVSGLPRAWPPMTAAFSWVSRASGAASTHQRPPCGHPTRAV